MPDREGREPAPLALAEEDVQTVPALPQSDECLRLALDAAGMGWWQWDLSRGVLGGDERCKALLWMPADAPTGFEHFLSLLHPEDRPRVEAEVVRAVRGPGEYESDFRVLNSSGQLRWIHVKGRSIAAGGRPPHLLMGVAFDVTRQRLAELALRKSEETSRQQLAELRAIYDNAPVGLSVLDTDLRFCRINRRLAEINGLPPESHLGRSVGDLLPDLGAQAKAILRRVLQTGEPVLDVEFTGQTPAQPGQERVWRESFLPLRGPDGAVIGLNVVCEEITEQKRAEEELRQAKAAAEAANVAKSQFLANVSHELRTPMTGIMGMTDLALQQDLPEGAREDLLMVKASAETLLALLNDLLDFSRIESGSFELESIPFCVRGELDRATRLLGVRAFEKQVGLVCHVAGDVPQWVIGDPLRLRQILMNLVSNAIKFTEQGEVAVRVEVQERSPQADVLRFSVSDTGIGIPCNAMARIFAPFTQADASTTRRYGGTGLGLTISKSLVERMGGRIWAESDLGVGSTFHFSLPLAPCEGLSDDARPAGASGTRAVPARPTGPLTPRNCRPARLRILVAEDTPANQKLVQRILERRGHAVDVADNGIQALDMIRSHPFDVVLMDVQMPEMDGFQVTAAVRKLTDPARAKLPIIAMTAHALPGDQQRCLLAGMDHYLAKPIDAGEMIRLVEQWAGWQDRLEPSEGSP